MIIAKGYLSGLFCHSQYLVFLPHKDWVKCMKTMHFKDWSLSVPGFWVSNDFLKINLINYYLSFSLQKILGLDSLEEVLDVKLVNSKFIIHNVYSVSKQGVVILDDKSSKCTKITWFLVDSICWLYRSIAFYLTLL